MPKSDGYKNLQPLNTKSKEEQRKIQKAGGEAAAKTYARRRLLREIAASLLPMKNEATGEANDISMVKAQIEKAIKDGDTQAFNALRDLVGEKPTDKQELLSNNLQININRLPMLEQKDI